MTQVVGCTVHTRITFYGSPTERSTSMNGISVRLLNRAGGAGGWSTFSQREFRPRELNFTVVDHQPEGWVADTKPGLLVDGTSTYDAEPFVATEDGEYYVRCGARFRRSNPVV